MGATPAAAFLSLALPSSFTRTAAGKRWIARFFSGFQALAEQHEVTLAGGDTAESPTDLILADIVLLGSRSTRQSTPPLQSPPRRPPLRHRPLGGAAAELAPILASNSLAKSAAKRSNHPHLFPQPRLARRPGSLANHSLATAASISATASPPISPTSAPPPTSPREIDRRLPSPPSPRRPTDEPQPCSSPSTAAKTTSSSSPPPRHPHSPPPRRRPHHPHRPKSCRKHAATAGIDHRNPR